METKKGIDILLVEDDPGDALLIREYLDEKALGACLVHVERLADTLNRLAAETFDVVLLDLGLPDGRGIESFEEVHAKSPATPVIILTGLDDDESALAAVQKGAQDYLVKGQVDSALLIRSIRYAIERQRLYSQLEHSLQEIKTLRGILPICAGCKKIRDDKGYWTRLETYLHEHTGADFSHCLCQECMARLYPDFYKKLRKKSESDAGETVDPFSGPEAS